LRLGMSILTTQDPTLQLVIQTPLDKESEAKLEVLARAWPPGPLP
jgi:hypothetical protein